MQDFSARDNGLPIGRIGFAVHLIWWALKVVTSKIDSFQVIIIL